MKWPNSVTVLRHGQSAYNILKAKKMADPEYLAFKIEYEKSHRSKEAKGLAKIIQQKYALNISDEKTPLTTIGRHQAFITGQRAPHHIRKPNIIFCSPYFRTNNTAQEFCNGWETTGPQLNNVSLIMDDRLVEQNHGISLLYNDWRVFHVFHPEQKELHDLIGSYAYQFPQGESTLNVRERARQFMSMLIRECAGMDVLIVTHHLWKLSLRANLERLTPDQFIYIDEHEKPVNCGLTCYEGKSDLGRDGKLVLHFYNKQLYTSAELDNQK